jgi:hypothetical protein
MESSSFDALGKQFLNILGYLIEDYVCDSDKELWSINFNGNGNGGSIRLFL